MGNLTNGKGSDQGRSYYEYQLSLFRWRADPNHNAYLPRVHFSPKSQQLQRQRFTHIMEQQLQQHLFVDLDALKTLGNAAEGEVIVFQQFAARLSELEGALEAGECIYALIGLIQGYERILARLGRTHIEMDFCFVTIEGEVRAWLSENPASNDLPGEIQVEIGGEVQKLQVFSSEAGVIKRLLELNRRLSTNNNRNYSQFSQEIKKFVKTNMLQNCNFSAVRRFINRYLFIHGLTLPYSLAKALQRNKVVRFQSTSQEQEISKQQMTNLATRGQLSTQVQLDYLQTPQHQQLKKCSSFINKSETPNITIESKMIVDPSCKTPKTQAKYNPLESTFINSQMLLSRQKGKENLRKGQSFHKSKNQLERPRQRGHQARFSQTHPILLKKQKRQGNTTSGKISVKFHSRQPSLDQQSNSMFISPATQKVDFGVHYSYTPQRSNPSVKAKQAQDERQRCDDAFSNPPSSNAEKQTSQLLARQVSGLVSNRELSICESLGTFQSIENSKDSGYKGVLTKMGRTAKMVNLPTGKRLATFFWNGQSQPHLTQ